MRAFLCASLLSLLLLPVSFLGAADEKPLTFEILGLKNNYRILFDQWDDANHFAAGALEIADNNEDKVHTRIPFTAQLSVDPKDKKTEILTIGCIAMDFFFPPANKKDPYPALTWKLVGRKTSKPVLKAAFWTFGKDAWKLEPMEFEKSEK